MATKLLTLNIWHHHQGMRFSKTGPVRKIIVTVFLFLAFSSAFAQDAESYYKQGCEKQIYGKYEEAIIFFDKAIALKGDFVMIWLNRGYCKSLLGLFKEAIADYSQAIKIDPTYKDGWYNSGLDKYELGDYKGSLADLTAAIALDSNDGKFYFSRALALEALHKKDSACADFKKSLGLGFAEAKQNVDQCNELAKNKALKDNQGISGTEEVQPRLVTQSSVTENKSNIQNNFVVLDATGGYTRLVAQGPMISTNGSDTSYGILFSIMPPPTGEPDAVVIYDQKLTLKQSAAASIDLQLKDGKTVHAKLVLTAENQPTTKPVIFLGLFDRVNKKILGENDIDKIKIDSGKIKYAYVIANAYTDKIKNLLQKSAVK